MLCSVLHDFELRVALSSVLSRVSRISRCLTFQSSVINLGFNHIVTSLLIAWYARNFFVVKLIGEGVPSLTQRSAGVDKQHPSSSSFESSGLKSGIQMSGNKHPWSKLVY